MRMHFGIVERTVVEAALNFAYSCKREPGRDLPRVGVNGVGPHNVQDFFGNKGLWKGLNVRTAWIRLVLPGTKPDTSALVLKFYLGDCFQDPSRRYLLLEMMGPTIMTSVSTISDFFIFRRCPFNSKFIRCVNPSFLDFFERGVPAPHTDPISGGRRLEENALVTAFERGLHQANRMLRGFARNVTQGIGGVEGEAIVKKTARELFPSTAIGKFLDAWTQYGGPLKLDQFHD